jgi:sec-independent protein translocase protein TatA
MLGMWAPGPLELIVIGIVAVLIFGRRLPEIIGNLGKGIKEFRLGLKEENENINSGGKNEKA